MKEKPQRQKQTNKQQKRKLHKHARTFDNNLKIFDQKL